MIETTIAQAIDRQTIVGGDSFSAVIKRGQRMVLVDDTGHGNLALLAFHARSCCERYNMPDTLKGQHTAILNAGNVLYSDMGRVLLSIVVDECGGHDPFGAYSHREQVDERYGSRSYQEHRNDWRRNGYDNLLIELGKHGLDGRDLHAPVNWFTRLRVHGPAGRFRFEEAGRRTGRRVLLRAELDTLVIASATPHPFDTAAEWQPAPITVHLAEGTPAGPDDPCRQHCEQNARAFALTDQAALAY